MSVRTNICITVATSIDMMMYSHNLGLCYKRKKQYENIEHLNLIVIGSWMKFPKEL